MKCTGCAFEASSDFAFCPKCGTRLPAACPSCGTECSPDFAFCPRCGARLAAAGSAPANATPARGAGERGTSRPASRDPHEGDPRDIASEADRRPVTVVFADVSGFTALSERLDPEDVRAFQSDLFQEMAAVVGRYEGFVEKFVGDAVMAVFGAPVAHEDDPERALRAALAMHEGMEGLNGRWEGRVGRPLFLHLGVNTGPVVAGKIGSTADGAYAVTGDTVNTASRLQSAAKPGQILVSASTYALTQHLFAFEPLGELALKGKAGPLPVYGLRGALAAPRSARGLDQHGVTVPLVGREDELGQLAAAFDRMRRGRAQVVSVVGEAGVGKSRLVDEFLGRLAEGGRLHEATVRRATCSSLGEQTYGVLAAYVREAYGVAHDDAFPVILRKLVAGLQALGADEEASSIASLLGTVLGLEPGHGPAADMEPEHLKRNIFLAARTLMERRLAQGPLLLVVDNLQWADAASIELLRFMVDRLADRPLMLLLVHRPAFDAGRLATGRAPHTILRLPPLSRAESEELLATFCGPSADHVPVRLRELLVTRAGGNPLYLEEFVRGLVAAGLLVREGDVWVCRVDVAAVEVPATLQGLILARVDRLPADARRLLQEAAVLGPVFDLRLLQLVCSEPNACEPYLDLLQDAELVAEGTQGGGASVAGPGGRHYRFGHALVQEVVYQNLLVRRRTELHGRAGRALETVCAGQPERLEDLEALGHHFSLSADKARGARYLLAAGDWARAIYANEDAVRHYERALATLHECEGCGSERLAAREGLGDLLGLTGRRDAALTHFEAVREAYAAAGDPAGEARLHRKMGRLHWEAGDRNRALACCRAGLALLEGRVEHIELAHLHQEMGRMAFRSGDNSGAAEWAGRALAQAERLAAGLAGPAAADDAGRQREFGMALSHAYNTLGAALARMGRPEEAVGHVERSVAVAQAHGLLQAACRGYANLGVLCSTLDPGRAIETCSSGLELAKRIGDFGFQSRLYANLAVAYCALTNRCDEQGIGAARAAIELDRRLGQLDHLAVPLIVLGQIYQCHGEPQRALSHYREALDLAEQAGEAQLLFPCYDGLATIYLEMGDEVQAEEYLRKAQQVCEAAGLEPDSLAVLPFLD